MGISINDITAGIGLLINGEIFIVTEYHHIKPGKGAAFARVKLKNLKNDLVVERTFRSADKLEEVFLEEKHLQYLYRAGDMLHFMDQNTFEEMIIPQDAMGESLRFLQENLEVTVMTYKNQIQKVVIPNFIVTQIIQTEPGVKGDSMRAGTKPAAIDTEAVVQVPLFINTGDWVKIDTRTGAYVERVQK